MQPSCPQPGEGGYVSSDDPWRKPDPGSSFPPPAGPAQPPGYGPVPGYGPPPGYAPPPPGYPGFNPYAAPPPQRSGIARLVWILSILGILLLGGCGVAVFFLVQSVSRNADAVNNFLRDVR